MRKESATIAFVDVVESVLLMAKSEAAVASRIRDLLNRAERETVPACRGVVAERRGDCLVLKFGHTRDAARCAALMHTLAAAEHAEHPGDEPLRLRAGLHKTDLLADDGAIYGAGVNLAARIAGVAQPGETWLSSAARDELTPPLDGLLQDMGPCYLKHVDGPVRLFRHREDHPPLPADIEAAISARMKLRPMIAVLPLDGAPLDGDTPFGLGDIVADQLIRRLSQSSVLHVISALSALALRGRNVAPQALYEMLRTDYVLRGRIEDRGGGERHRRVQLHAELWRRGSPEPVWSDVFSGSGVDVLSPDGELLGRIVHAVSQRIITVEQRTAQWTQALPTLASHTLYLSAVDLLHRFTVDEFHRARQLLVALSERAPRHAEPMAWLARWHVFRVVQGWSDDRRRDGEQALYYSDRALDRDPTSSLALTMAGSVHAGIKRDAQTAQTMYQQALDSNPNDSLAWLMSGVAQGFMNAREPALAASETALGLAPVDPTRPYYDALSATAALRAGEYERCITLAERAITASVAHGTAYRSMAIAQMLLGRHEEAKATIGRMVVVEPHFTVQTYLARVPTQDRSEHFAQLLQEAGLPPH
jgi:class 3 adenylate cyclase/TolB-like protein/tetratricopeptide (TPR) repeat protein